MPSPYLEHPGEPNLQFKTWLAVFNDFIDMSDAHLAEESKMSDKQKNAYLFALLGTEGIRIFSTDPAALAKDTTTYANFSKAATEVFGVPVNKIRALYDFQMRTQGATETTMEYLSALRAIAADCEFGALLKNRLAIQLAVGCHQKETQEKLLSEVTVNCDRFVTLMQADESARASSSAIRGERKTTAVINTQSKNQRTPKTTPRRPTPSNRPDSQTTQHPCPGCGNDSHRYKDPECPALNAKCRFCSIRGHYDSCCRKKNPELRSRSYNRPAKQNQQKVLNLQSVTSKRKFLCSITISVGSNTFADLEAEVDTGSDVTAVPQATYFKNFSNCTLNMSNDIMCGYDQKPIRGVLGYFNAEVHFKGRSCLSRIYVVPDECSIVIGKDVIQALKIIIEGNTFQVSTVQAQSFKQVLESYPSLLQKSIGDYPDYEHDICLQADAFPSSAKLRSVPLARREAVDKEITTMVEQGIWEKVERSRWSHGMVTVPKPNGDIRITTDLRKLNQYVIPLQYPLPTTQDIFLKLRNAKVFTKMDFSKAYFSVPLSQASRELTTTSTPVGLMQYRKLPMGLKDSASVFQFCATQTLKNCPGTVVFIDDILVFGSNQKEHDLNLQNVLKALSEKNFRLNFDKCIYSVSEVPFLGHIVSSNGDIKPDPRNIQAISEAPVPQSANEVQRFLGMINYYHEFLPDLASIAEPLRRFTRKNVKFQWSEECSKSYSTLKAMAADNLKVFIFDQFAPTFVTTDASDVGVGAVLSQLQGNREVPIAFASHTLSQRERNFSASEREGYACIWACELWEKFLLGRQFTLRTDHQALKTLLQKQKSQRQSSKFIRWLDRLSVFNYSVEYRKAEENQVADALSRLSLKAQALAVDTPSVSVAQITVAGLSLKEFRSNTASDPELREVAHYIETSWPPRSQLKAELTPYFQIRDELQNEDGYVIRTPSRILVPLSLRDQILKESHVGHPGIVRMKRKLRETFWWPNMDTQIERLVKYCAPCQHSAKSAPPPNVPPQSIPTPAIPGELYGLDITGPFATAPTNQRFLVVLVDYHSNWPEVLATGDITSAKIIQWLEGIFARYGNPAQILSDNGKQFVSTEFTAFLKSRDIQHLRSAVYNPQTNGKVEVFNRYLKHGLQAYDSESKPWQQALNELLFSYRGVPLADGESPAKKFLGRSIRMNFEPARRPTPIRTDKVVVTPAASNLTNRGPYFVGDMVLFKRPHVPKGRSPYSDPIKVIEVLGNYTYRLADNSIWNARKLRRFHETHEPVTTDFAVGPAPPIAPAQLRRSQRTNKGIPPQRYSPK